jgi:hypothetical protein
MRRQAAALSGFFVLAGCSGQEASDRLRQDMPTVEVVDIIHARFPCYSPDFHFYGISSGVKRKVGRWKNRTIPLSDAGNARVRALLLG